MASSDGSLVSMITVGILAVTGCATAFIFGGVISGMLPLLFGAHQTPMAVIVAIVVVLLWSTLSAHRAGQKMISLLRDALRPAFTPPARIRSVLLMLLIGVPLTGFYLLALPAERFGALASGALAFLTPGDALAAVLIGFGVPASIALNLAAQRIRAAQTTLTFGGVIAALLPSSLCCTTLIPSALAALGASAPVIMHTSGRFQGFFAQYSAAFIGFAVAAVLFSLWLAARNLVAGATICPLSTKESR